MLKKLSKNQVLLILRIIYFLWCWVFIFAGYIFDRFGVRTTGSPVGVGRGWAIIIVGAPLLLYIIYLENWTKPLNFWQKVINTPLMLFFLWRPYSPPRPQKEFKRIKTLKSQHVSSEKTTIPQGIKKRTTKSLRSFVQNLFVLFCRGFFFAGYWITITIPYVFNLYDIRSDGKTNTILNGWAVIAAGLFVIVYVNCTRNWFRLLSINRKILNTLMIMFFLWRPFKPLK